MPTVPHFIPCSYWNQQVNEVMAKSLNLHQKTYNIILTAVGVFCHTSNNIVLKSEIYVVFLFMYMQSFEIFSNLGFGIHVKYSWTVLDQSE